MELYTVTTEPYTVTAEPYTVTTEPYTITTKLYTVTTELYTVTMVFPPHTPICDLCLFFQAALSTYPYQFSWGAVIDPDIPPSSMYTSCDKERHTTRSKVKKWKLIHDILISLFMSPDPSLFTPLGARKSFLIYDIVAFMKMLFFLFFFKINLATT